MATFLIQDDTQVKSLDVSSYLVLPLNSDTYLKSLKNQHQNLEEKASFTSPDEQYNYFLEQSKRKLNEFLKYNSVVDMSFRNKKIDFLIDSNIIDVHFASNL